MDDLDPEPDEFGRERPKPPLRVAMSKLDDEILALDETHLTELGGENLNAGVLLSRDTRQVPYPRYPSCRLGAADARRREEPTHHRARKHPPRGHSIT